MDASGLINMLLQCSYLFFTLNWVHAHNKWKMCLIILGLTLTPVCDKLEFWINGTSWKVLNLVKLKMCLKCGCLEKIVPSPIFCTE